MAQTFQRLTAERRSDPGTGAAVWSDLHHRLGADIRIANQSKRNVNDGLCYLRVAEAVLEEVTRLLTPAVLLAEQAQTGMGSDPERARIDSEAEPGKLLSTVRKLLEGSTFNGAPVFSTAESASEGFTVALAVGNHPAAPTKDAGTNGQVLSAIHDSACALQASLGSSMQRLTADTNVLGIQVENLAAAYTQIRDTGIAEEIVNLTKFQILNQSGTIALSQAYPASPQVLALIRLLRSGQLAFRDKAAEVFPGVAG